MMLLARRADMLKSFKEAISFEDLALAAARVGKNCATGRAFVFLGYMSFLFRKGAILTARENGGTRVGFRTDRLESCLEFLRELTVRKKLSPFCSESYNIYNKSPFVGGPGLVECRATTVTKGGSHRFAAMPVESGGVEPLFPVPSLHANAATFYPEECWDFIKFILSDKAQKIIAGTDSFLPAAKDVCPSESDVEKRRAIKAALSKARPVYEHSATLYNARFIIESMIERHLKGEMGIEPLRSEMEFRVNRFMKNCK
jgi:hypothetical protein